MGSPWMIAIGAPQWIVLGVALLRLAELAYARRNSRALLARGGREVGARHYPLFVLLHGAWLLCLFTLVPADATVNRPLGAAFIGLLLLRLWVIASLGPFWTTRIITVPGARLVKRGPYRFLRHPNYLVVVVEIALLPLVFGAWPLALIFSALNLPLILYRIRIENAALADRRGL